MACSVIRDSKNEITQVLAPNGKESKLFDDINSKVGDKEQSLRMWASTHTAQFKQQFGNWNLLSEALSHSDGIKGIYKEIFKDNPQESLFEASVQSHSSAAEHKTTVHTFGARLVEIARELFPNAKVGDEYVPAISGKTDVNGEPLIKYVYNEKVLADSIYFQKGDKSPFEPSGKIQTILQKLYNKFGIEYAIVNNPNVKLRGWFVDDKRGGNYKVNVNLAYANPDTPFHEYLHPFIAVLREQNPILYNNLMDQMLSDVEGMKLYSQIRAVYPERSEVGIKEEALVHYLGELAERKYNEPKSPFNRFINWLKSLFKKIQIDFKTLSLDMKLSDIANLVIDDVYVADLRSMLANARCLSSEQKVDTELTYESIFGRIKDKVAILGRTIKNRKKGDQFKEDIEMLNEIIKNSDEITSINNFVSNSVYYMDAAYKRFERLRNSVKNASNLSKGELSYNLNVLAEIQQLLNVYDSLNDVKSLFLRQGIDTKDDNFGKLRDAIDKKDLMIEDFKSFALTYLTEWLYPYIEHTNNNLESKGHKDLILTKEKFREQMVTALRDISAAGYWLGTTINSRDPVSAAIGLALKDIIYDNHVRDLHIKNELSEEYKKVRGSALYKSSKDEEDFNLQFLREADVWEKIGVDENGEPEFGYVKRLAFHTEFMYDMFDKAKRELYEQIGPRPTDADALKKWKQAQTEWYLNNTQIVDNFQQVIADKKKTLTPRQFEAWLLANTKEIDNLDYGYGRFLSDYYGRKVISVDHQKGTFKVISGELIKPANKYRNKQYASLVKNPYYNKLYNTYHKANEQLGHFGLRYGIIPQLSKGKGMFSDLSWKDGVKENIKKLGKNAVDSVEANLDNDKTVQRQDGSEVKNIPIYYTRMLNPQDLKLDLLESVLKFSQMSNNYDKMAEIEPNIIVLKTILNGDFNLGIKGREVAKTNGRGAQVMNAITGKIVPKMAREDMLNNRLNEFINDVVYGDEEFAQNVGILGKEISVNKISGKIALLTALQNMAVNINGGINNVVVGNFNNSIEAVGGRFFGKKDLLWANSTYFKEMPKFIAEISGQGESAINKLADHYDVPQGEFQDHYGNHISGGQVNKLFKTSSLFFLQKGGEHEIQLTAMLALMKSTKLKDKAGNDINLYEAWTKAGGDFNKVLSDNQWSDEQDKAFRNSLHAIVKNLHGVYNRFDKATLQRRWYGKMALMFRKYLFKAISSRYGKEYVDYELGDIDGGYWRSFASKLFNDVKEYKWAAIQKMWTKEGYSDFQASALNKTVYELGVIIAVFALIGVAGSGDDDKSWLDSEMQLQLTRFSADITQYINPSDFIRVVRNPAASVNMIEKWLSWFAQLFNPTEEYKRASGIAKKGDNKLYIKTLKLMPVVRQFVNILTPEEQIKFYQLTGR